MPTQTFNSGASPILDWWMIDEIAIRQYPLRAVGDAMTRFTEHQLGDGDHHLSSLFSNVARMAHQFDAAREDGQSPAAQLSLMVSGIDRLTGFNRRLVQGNLPAYPEMPPSQQEMSREAPVAFRQTVAALDFLAQELCVIRKFLSDEAPHPQPGTQSLQGIAGHRQSAGEQKSSASLRLVR